MKYLILLVAVVVAARYAEAAQCGCATETLHVRDGAGTTHTIIHTMNAGECLPYQGNSQAGGGYTWMHLTYNGKDAWAASNWLTIKDCSSGGSTSTNALQLPGCPRIITRAEWGARPPSNHFGDMPHTPIYVFIHHGTGGSCHDRASCEHFVKVYQNYHMDTHGWPDIGYNFVVGEDGNAYEARGWTKLGAHTLGYNHNGIAICMIGDFSNHVPNDKALATVKQLIKCGLDNKKISATYTLKGHRDVGSTACPGQSYYNLIHSWPHYVAGTGLFHG